MKINIDNQNIELRFRFRSEILFEEIAQKSFQGESVAQWILYFYCTLIANTDDGFIEYDSFVKWLDDNPDALYEFIEFYTKFQSGVLEKRQKAIEAAAKKKAPRKKKS